MKKGPEKGASEKRQIKGVRVELKPKINPSQVKQLNAQPLSSLEKISCFLMKRKIGFGKKKASEKRFGGKWKEQGRKSHEEVTLVLLNSSFAL